MEPICTADGRWGEGEQVFTMKNDQNRDHKIKIKQIDG